MGRPIRIAVHLGKRSELKRLYFIGDTAQSEGCSGDIAFSSALRLAEMI